MGHEAGSANPGGAASLTVGLFTDEESSELEQGDVTEIFITMYIWKFAITI